MPIKRRNEERKERVWKTARIGTGNGVEENAWSGSWLAELRFNLPVAPDLITSVWDWKTWKNVQSTERCIWCSGKKAKPACEITDKKLFSKHEAWLLFIWRVLFHIQCSSLGSMQYGGKSIWINCWYWLLPLICMHYLYICVADVVWHALKIVILTLFKYSAISVHLSPGWSKLQIKHRFCTKIQASVEGAFLIIRIHRQG